MQSRSDGRFTQSKIDRFQFKVIASREGFEGRYPGNGREGAAALECAGNRAETEHVLRFGHRETVPLQVSAAR